MKTMSNHHHTNPIVSIISGAIFGISAFIQQHGFLIENALELLKVVSFGLIGGACGYFGKFVAEKWHRYLKEKAKKHCK
jgi:hypothetical protein